MLDIVKTPAVKPCIVYIIDLPDSVGSKELSAYRSVVAPLVIVTIVGWPCKIQIFSESMRDDRWGFDGDQMNQEIEWILWKMIYFHLKPHLVGGFKPWMDYFPFHIWDVIRNPLTHIFQDSFLTTNQSSILHHKAQEWESTVEFLFSHSRKKRSPLAQSMSSQLVLGQVIWYGAGYFFSVCTVCHK